MCNICNFNGDELDSVAHLMHNTIDVKIGNKVLEEHLLCLVIIRDENGCCYLTTEYYVDGGDPVSSIRVPIEYCPFCGEKLKEHEKKDYPWNKENEDA